MSAQWQILLNGVDVTSGFESFTISASITDFCFQLNAVLSNPKKLLGYNWNKVQKTPDIEVLTQNFAGALTSRGKYFI